MEFNPLDLQGKILVGIFRSTWFEGTMKEGKETGDYKFVDGWILSWLCLSLVLYTCTLVAWQDSKVIIQSACTTNSKTTLIQKKKPACLWAYDMERSWRLFHPYQYMKSVVSHRDHKVERILFRTLFCLSLANPILGFWWLDTFCQKYHGEPLSRPICPKAGNAAQRFQKWEDPPYRSFGTSLVGMRIWSPWMICWQISRTSLESSSGGIA